MFTINVRYDGKLQYKATADSMQKTCNSFVQQTWKFYRDYVQEECNFADAMQTVTRMGNVVTFSYSEE